MRQYGKAGKNYKHLNVKSTLNFKVYDFCKLLLLYGTYANGSRIAKWMNVYIFYGKWKSGELDIVTELNLIRYSQTWETTFFTDNLILPDKNKAGVDIVRKKIIEKASS